MRTLVIHGITILLLSPRRTPNRRPSTAATARTRAARSHTAINGRSPTTAANSPARRSPRQRDDILRSQRPFQGLDHAAEHFNQSSANRGVKMKSLLLTALAFGLLSSSSFAEEKSPEQSEESNEIWLQKMQVTRIVASGTNQQIS